MDNVLVQLKKYSTDIYLTNRYNWNFDGFFLNSIPEIGLYINAKSTNHFERNEALKFKLTEYFQQNPSNVEDLHFWIIINGVE